MEMRKKRHQSLSQIWILALPIGLALISLGCGLSETIAGITSSNNTTELSTSTRIPLPTFTPTPINIVEISSTDTQSQAPAVTEPELPTAEVIETEPVIPSPTPSPAPTEEAPPQADGPVTVTVLQNMNVRGGPGTNYPVIGAAPPGASSKGLGRNADSSWVQVEYPPGSGSAGWVYTSLVQIDGNLENVPIVQSPEPPPAAPAPPPEDSGPAPTPVPQYQFTPTAWHASENAGICHFKGRIRDEAGNFVYGYSVYVTNGSWGVISHPTGASHHYPDKNEEWDVAGVELKNCPGWWTLSVVRYECPDFEVRFEAQCKQFTHLSEQIPVQVKYPDEMVINADWVCHWDCDKGVYSQPFRR
jgi:hypothetical protein